MMQKFSLSLWMCVTLGLVPAGASEPRQEPAKEIVLRECLVIAPVGRYGRSAVHADALESQIVAGRWAPPKAGDMVKLADGSSRRWEPAQAAKDGALTHEALGGGYAFFTVPATQKRVMLLEANGHVMAYVNGEPRTGDLYQTGYVHLPVLLRQGTNDFLFHVGRGRLQAKLVRPKAEAVLDLSDTTVPDAVVGEAVKTWAAVVVINATDRPADDLYLRATCAGTAPVVTKVPALPPLGTRKVGFRLAGAAPEKEGTCPVALQLLRQEGEKEHVLDKASLNLNCRRPDQTRKQTFISDIDGSVQYYALVPARKDDGQKKKPALVLTLHGAAVEATGQAACYASRPGVCIVAPTNRRPYGFDWEDWGRLDAIEVLDLVHEQLDTDPRRTYLTGHSMGGHGTWHLGATYPDRFAAIGPSAGWISMWSYAGAERPQDPDPIRELLLRAASPSDTLALKRNYAQHGVYILHGDQDDNVPVREARAMRQHLAGFHPDFAYFEQPGAGHWWGNACVDWPPLFDFFARHTIPERAKVRQVDFVTASPGVSAWSHWLGIEAQIHEFKPSSASVRYDPSQRRFTGTTDNVARLAFDLRHIESGKPLHVELDGEKIEEIAWPKPARIWLRRAGGKWSLGAEPAASAKGPHRYGPFKEAFRNRVVFVYGTQGTAAENAWALAKARFDAETFWYRGNGSIDVLADRAFDAAADRDRNVILYGNADGNAAWKALLADSPVQVGRGRICVGDREEKGEDLGCLFLRPRPHSDRAVVGVVTGSGVAGMRLTDRLSYFFSGVGYPDCLVLGPDVLTHGSQGVRAAGFFGLDWGVASGEFAWRK
jgi:pimeloyl-ACP methyl ester carboxylesterase